MKKPFSLQRLNAILLLGILSCIILYYARAILIILLFAVLLAMLMTPLAERLEKRKISRTFSTILCLLVILVALFMIIGLVTTEIVHLTQNWPQIQEKLQVYLPQLQARIHEWFDVSPEKQVTFIEDQLKAFVQSAGKYFKGLIMGLTGTIASILLILAFMFLFLLQREKYEIFIMRLYKGNQPEEAKEILRKISKVSQRYLAGRLVSIIILTVLYYIGLVVIGIKNAFLLSAIAALLTIIPYIGPVIGGLFPTFMALVTEDSLGPVLAVVILLIVIQIIDNYFIEPYIVGGEVNLSVFFTIFILILGGYLWGIAGLILFIPLFGIAKIIFDHVEPLRPYGYLIGDQRKKGSVDKWWLWVKEKIYRS